MAFKYWWNLNILTAVLIHGPSKKAENIGERCKNVFLNTHHAMWRLFLHVLKDFKRFLKLLTIKILILLGWQFTSHASSFPVWNKGSQYSPSRSNCCTEVSQLSLANRFKPCFSKLAVETTRTLRFESKIIYVYKELSVVIPHPCASHGCTKLIKSVVVIILMYTQFNYKEQPFEITTLQIRIL